MSSEFDFEWESCISQLNADPVIDPNSGLGFTEPLASDGTDQADEFIDFFAYEGDNTDQNGFEGAQGATPAGGVMEGGPDAFQPPCPEQRPFSAEYVDSNQTLLLPSEPAGQPSKAPVPGRSK